MKIWSYTELLKYENVNPLFALRVQHIFLGAASDINRSIWRLDWEIVFLFIFY